MSKIYSALALSFLIGGALSACNEEKLPEHRVEQRSGLTEVSQNNWLTPQDDIQPEVWLLTHEASTGSKPSVDDAGKVRRSLIEASAKFNDSPRMIANRALQLEQMLKGEGVDESAIVLVGRLNGVIAAGRIESFGAAGQQYYNMRKAGFTDAQALHALAQRYGSSG